MTDFHILKVDWSESSPALSAIRRTVFIEEQNVPEELEWDGLDANPQYCLHLLAETEDGKPIGTVRLLINGHSGHIGRMAVLKEWRGHGVGRGLLDTVLKLATAQGLSKLWLNAQVQVTGFYALAGFEAIGDEFLDAGIPHRRMQRKPDSLRTYNLFKTLFRGSL